MPRITPLTAGLPINAVASGWPRATARAPTSTRNTSIRSRNRLARRILRRSLGIAAASRSAMLLTKPQNAVGAHGDAKRGGLDREATRVRKPRPRVARWCREGHKPSRWLIPATPESVRGFGYGAYAAGGT